eukprot:CAMPEP_0182597782 /NCGR_PEP_ID=MMETSP1324-20130603/86947_1 /TAXON_ID=236786 /ORGANISM="Florenciella sp., Strain RCC1587" /LENGTH=44 /DNA_ID= /DNA_START= /DNA_END= /DNA_ORIENTATION=
MPTSASTHQVPLCNLHGRYVLLDLADFKQCEYKDDPDVYYRKFK